MYRLIIFLLFLIQSVTPVMAASTTAPGDLQDLYFGETLFYAFQEKWFDAIARLDTELAQHHVLDQPELDTLYPYIGLAEFSVGDFELAYRMHQRAGRAISAVINGDVEDVVRNEALFRLARIYFRKGQPVNAQHALDRIDGEIPAALRHDLDFLRAHVLMANGHFTDAAALLSGLTGVEGLEGFATYNLGIARLLAGEQQKGLAQLDLSGQLVSGDPLQQAIRDKANLVLGDRLLGEENFIAAGEKLDRVRLEGPFSNRALLGSGWAAASLEQYDRALVPWSLLAGREMTDSAVQEALLAVPYAYGKLGVYSKAALLYGKALQVFGREIDRLSASIKSIREGKFLAALIREELKQDSNWVVKLRELPETPETYYLLDLMASHNFQESLKNYLDLQELLKKLEAWSGDLGAYEEIIAKRRDYYQPLLPEIDNRFRLLDSQMRLRLEQRKRIEKRLEAMLVVPRPDYLATAEERIAGERLSRLEQHLNSDSAAAGSAADRIRRLRGIITWSIRTDYDRRLTRTYEHLQNLNHDVEQLQQQYDSFVRVRQAATQSYQGYDRQIRHQRIRIAASHRKVEQLIARQGHLLEVMAVNELERRRERLEEFQVKARFAMADSYDRASRSQNEPKEEK